VFDPAGLREDLCELALGSRMQRTALVEEDGA